MAGMTWKRNQPTIKEQEKAAVIPDMHIHTTYCKHAKNTPKTVQHKLAKKGIWGSINEHAPLPQRFIDDTFIYEHPDEPKDNPDRLRYMHRCAMSFDRMEQLLECDATIPIGLEVDWIQGHEEEILANIRRFKDMYTKAGRPLNHISCSVHYVESYNVFRESFRRHVRESSVQHLIDTYFSAIVDAVDSGEFDFVCHISLLHLAINQSLESPMLEDQDILGQFFEGYQKVLAAAAKNDTCIELNTSGIDRPFLDFLPEEEWSKYCLDSPYPHMPLHMLQKALTMGCKVVVGSDWHDPGNNSYDPEAQRYFDQAYDVLKALGPHRVYKIENRERVKIDL